MARTQQESGHDYYASVSLHNAAIAQSVAGDHGMAIDLGHQALDAFDSLSYGASEKYSTHAVLATAWAELGDWERAEEHIRAGQAAGGEHADVPAAFAYLCVRVGERERAAHFVADADALERQGLSDLEAVHATTIARAFLELSVDRRSLSRC